MARSFAFLLSLWAAVTAMTPAQEPRAAGADGVPVPRRLRAVQPEYPPEALAAGQRGIVILELTIDAKGKVSNVKVTRSVPPFDAAAVAAARLWEYEPVTVEGRPIPVRLTVPVSFSLRLPEISRQPGIPELRAGAGPAYPSGGKGKGGSASIAITISPSGEVLETAPVEGPEPFSEALMKAARTWRFVPIDGEETATVRLDAKFRPPDGERREQIDLRLSGLHREVPVSAAGRVAQAAQAQAPPATDARSEPLQAPAGPQASAPLDASPSPATASDLRTSSAAVQPSVETIAAPPPPSHIAESGAPAIRDVRFEGQIPDLIRGRRPTVPPMARISGISGDVTVSFSVDAAGITLVRSIEGPEILKKAADELIRSWAFRRLSPERIFLSAVVSFKGDVASAIIRPQGQ